MLQQDKSALNVVTLVTGETLRGSWWSHPKGKLIFRALYELDDHDDVLFTKLVDGKVTLVHRKLWPALLAIATSNESWQTRGLSADARRVVAKVNRSAEGVQGTPKVVKEIEARLLANSRQMHSESGKHVIVLDSWTNWARRSGIEPLASIDAAKEEIERAATAVGAARSTLPWRQTSS